MFVKQRVIPPLRVWWCQSCLFHRCCSIEIHSARSEILWSVLDWRSADIWLPKYYCVDPLFLGFQIIFYMRSRFFTPFTSLFPKKITPPDLNFQQSFRLVSRRFDLRWSHQGQLLNPSPWGTLDIRMTLCGCFVGVLAVFFLPLLCEVLHFLCHAGGQPVRGTTAVWQCSDHAGGEQSFSVLVVSFYDWLVGWLDVFFLAWRFTKFLTKRIQEIFEEI